MLMNCSLLLLAGYETTVSLLPKAVREGLQGLTAARAYRFSISPSCRFLSIPPSHSAEGPTLPLPTVRVQFQHEQRRSSPDSGVLRRVCYHALGAREQPQGGVFAGKGR